MQHVDVRFHFDDEGGLIAYEVMQNTLEEDNREVQSEALAQSDFWIGDMPMNLIDLFENGGFKYFVP